MDNTIDLSQLTLQESGKMDYYKQDGFQKSELLFEADANELDENPETDESLSSDNCFDSDNSLDSDESPDGDEYLEVADKADTEADVSDDNEHDQDAEELQAEDVALHAQEEELDRGEGAQMEAGAPDDIKVAPKKSPWLTRWFQRREELY